MNIVAKRHWPGIALGTVCALLVTSAIVVISDVQFVRDRIAMRKEIEDEGSIRILRTTTQEVPFPYGDNWKREVVQVGTQSMQLSMLRRLLGDEPGPYMIKRNAKAMALESARLFPEAEVWHLVGPADVVPEEYRELMQTALRD